MKLKLDIYTTRLCRKLEKTVEANDFELSTGVCEDVMNIINIDMFEGGLQALSEETQQELVLNLIKNGYPFFVDLVKEIFEITDDEADRIKVSDVAKVVIQIVKYSLTQLSLSFGVKNSKN